MTTGTKIIGNTYAESPYYSYRNWSGANGKTVQLPGQPKFFVKRTLVGWDRVIDVQESRVKLGSQPRWKRLRPGVVVNQEIHCERLGKRRLLYRRTVTLDVPRYESHTVVRYAYQRITTQWNAYTVTARTAVQTKGASQWLAFYAPNCKDTALIWSANDDLKLLSKLSEATRGHAFNLGVALGEGRETVKLVVNTANRLVGALRCVRRGRLDLALRNLGASPQPQHLSRNPRKGKPYIYYDKRLKQYVTRHRELTSTDISSMWLEIQYGWAPLIQDVHESAKAYAALTSKARQDRIIVSHRVTNEWKDSNYNLICNYYGIAYSSKRYIYERTEVLSAARSLGLCDPRSVAWELVPFSFVADWFIPIGTYFDALATIPKLSGRFLLQQRRINKFQMKCSAPNAYNIAYRGAVSNTYTTWYNRSEATSVPVPLPEFNDITKALSLGHLRNALALLHVNFKK